MTTTRTSTIEEMLSDSPIPAFIGGEWRAAAGGGVIEVLDPATGRPVTAITAGGAPEIDLAIEAAWKAFPSWSALAANERAVYLHRLADVMEGHADEIARLESLDVGKPLGDASGFDVPFGIQAFRFFADVAVSHRRAEPLALAHMDARQVLHARGPVGFIFPWNFPFMLLAWGAAPALAAGNTIVVKPAELTPLTTLFWCHLAEEAGIPPGVVNVVPGYGHDAGSALSASPRIKLVSFTGSPEVGRLVATAAAQNLVPSKLELGGKGAAVVFDDVDPKATARKLADAITLNAGQVCCTATRWLIHERILDEVVGEAVSHLTAVNIGPGSDGATAMGPVVSDGQRNRILGYLDRGSSSGASFLLEGGAVSPAGSENGYFVSPALLTGPSDNVCAREEIFGPVAYVMSFSDEHEVVARVNSSPYGLANSVWSDDLDRANRVAEALVAGNSWVNAHNVFAYGLPYGGVNLSGWGGGVNAAETYFDYLRKQTIARPLS